MSTIERPARLIAELGAAAEIIAKVDQKPSAEVGEPIPPGCKGRQRAGTLRRGGRAKR
jgi:hypothetical protein